MHMAMFNFLWNGRAHIQHIQLELQNLTSPRMVTIQHHGIAFDFQHIENGFTAIWCATPQLPPYLHARWEIFLGHGLQQAFIALTKGIGSAQHQCGLVAFVLAI